MKQTLGPQRVNNSQIVNLSLQTVDFERIKKKQP